MGKGIKVVASKFTIQQEEDCCGRVGETHQHMDVEIADGGGGPYYVISTKRWAFNSPDELAAALTPLMAMVSAEEPQASDARSVTPENANAVSK